MARSERWIIVIDAERQRAERPTVRCGDDDVGGVVGEHTPRDTPGAVGGMHQITTKLPVGR